MRQTRLILIRHGETPWTRARRYQGRSETSLTRTGMRQAKAVARWLGSQEVDLLYTSAMKRARQTQRAISRLTGKKAQVDARLNEISFGSWEGKTAAELIRAKDGAFLKWCKGVYATPRGGEPLARFRKRALAFLKEALQLGRGKTIAAVTHGGPIRMIVSQAFEFKRPFWNVPVEAGSITVLSFNSSTAKIVTLNQTTHLKEKS